MGIFNGSKYILDQLDSINAQTIDTIDIFLSADNPHEETAEIARTYADRWAKGDYRVVDGPARGFAENYRYLLASFGQDHDYVAFADQDDIWDKDKLEVAIDWLSQHPDVPALYCSRTRYVDANGNFLRLSPLFAKPPGVRNALVQSIAGGNTMVMNRKAAQLLEKACHSGPIVTHDWWSYLVVSACGGIVHYDRDAHISYRQHDNNLFGANDTTVARIERIIELFRGRFAQWTNLNLAGLREINDLLTEDAREAVTTLEAIRAAQLPTRLKLFMRSGMYRQTKLGTWGLFVAVIFGLL